MLHRETVSPELLDLTKKLMQDEKLQDFRLVGGTALALQFGHRKSIDIDLFTNKPFDAKSPREHIDTHYPTAYSGHAHNGVTTRITDTRVDLTAHQYPWLKPPIIESGIRMASPEDIAAMKMNAINRSGDRPKDFIDIYVILEKMALNDILTAYQQKYPDIVPSIAKESVGTFGGIEPAEEIKLLNKPVSWREVKSRLNNAVKNPDKIFKGDILTLLPKKKNNSNNHKQGPRF